MVYNITDRANTARSVLEKYHHFKANEYETSTLPRCYNWQNKVLPTQNHELGLT